MIFQISTGAILPADIGLGSEFLAIVFILISLGVIGMLIAVLWSNRHPSEDKWMGMAKREGWYTVIFLIVVLVFATSTLGLLPYPYAHQNIHPTMVVNARAQQFQWCIAYAPNWGTNCQAIIKIPVGNVVLFNTSTIDVNHGFGLYASNGNLLDQVQVMPGFYNTIIYNFSQPGLYYVRCLEFCGYGHFGMVSEINVTSS